MTALTKDRKTTQRLGEDFSDPMAAAAKIFAGAIVCLNAAGDAVKGSVSTTLKVRGIAQETVDNTNGAAGNENIPSRKGVFHLAQDGTITRADIGGTAYIVDDQTVADNNGTNTRSACGTIVDVDVDGVFIRIA